MKGQPLTSLPKETPKLLDRQTSVLYETAHGVRVDRVVSRDRDDTDSIRHDDVLALPDEAKTGLLEGTDGFKMVDARESWHA